MKKSSKKKTRRKKAAHTSTILNDAIQLFERSESPFYKGMQLLKIVKKDTAELFANRDRYMHASRALNIIAAAPCEAKNENKQKCYETSVNKKEWCWPCYAERVTGGDTP